VKLPKSHHGHLQIGDKVGFVTAGAFAEYVAIPAWKVAKLPENVDTKSAAAIFLQGLTALTFVKEAYHVNKGDTVLIYSAAGGLGSIFVGLALHIGATVIGTVSSDEKVQYVKGLGAQYVINTSKQKVVEEVLKITNNEGVHVAYDGVGKDTFDDNFKIVRRKGTIVSLGNASGPVPAFSPLALSEKNLKLVRPRLFSYIHTPEETKHYENELLSLFSKGVFHAKIHEVYPFSAEGVKKSQKDITARGTIGKLLINVGGK